MSSSVRPSQKSVMSGSATVVAKQPVVDTPSTLRRCFQPLSCNVKRPQGASGKLFTPLAGNDNATETPIFKTAKQGEQFSSIDEPVEIGPPPQARDTYEDILPFEERLSMLPVDFRAFFELPLPSSQSLSDINRHVFEEEVEELDEELAKLTASLF